MKKLGLQLKGSAPKETKSLRLPTDHVKGRSINQHPWQLSLSLSLSSTAPTNPETEVFCSLLGPRLTSRRRARRASPLVLLGHQLLYFDVLPVLFHLRFLVDLVNGLGTLFSSPWHPAVLQEASRRRGERLQYPESLDAGRPGRERWRRESHCPG